MLEEEEMFKKSSLDAFVIPVGLSNIISSTIGEQNASKEFEKKYNIGKMPLQDRVKFYDALNKRFGLKKDIAWGAGRIIAQGAGIVAGAGIADEVINNYYPEYKEYTPEVVAVGAALGVAPMSYISSKMYTKALGENSVNKSGIKPNTGVDNVKQSSWKEGYTKKELEKIAACAKQEKDAANVFDLDNGNNNITSSKYRTIEQSQNISKILPKFQRKGGVLPATITPKPVPTNLARKA